MNRDILTAICAVRAVSMQERWKSLRRQMKCLKCGKEFTEFEGEEEDFMCYECLDKESIGPNDPGDECDILRPEPE